MKTLRLAALVALLLLAQIATTTAQDAPAVKEFRYVISHTGADIGWVRASIRETELQGEKAILERTETYIAIRRNFDDAAFVIKGSTDSWFKPDWSPLRKVDVTINGNQTRRVEVSYGKTITMTETVDKQPPTSWEFEPGELPIYSEHQAWRQLVKDGAKAGAQLRFQDVDVTSHTLSDKVWSVYGDAKVKVGDEIMTGLDIGIVDSGQGARVVMGADGMPLRYQVSAGFVLTRVARIPDPFKPDVFQLSSMMDANVRVGDDVELERMELEFEYDHEADRGLPDIADSNDYHDVKRTDEGYALLLKAQRLPEGAEEIALPPADIPDDISVFLRATPMCQSDHKVLASESARLVKDKETAVAAIRAISAFVHRRLKDGSGATGGASALQAYRERQGDCTEHAALFVALARAAGIPARNAGGIVYLSAGDKGVFGYHAWAEVWLGQWVPVDTTVLEIGVGARYILLEYDEPGDALGRGRAGRCLGQGVHPVINWYALRDGKDWTRKDAQRRFKASASPAQPAD